MNNRFLIYFVFLLAWIFGVVGIFWWIPDQKLAGLVAGVMFCGMPITILLTEKFGYGSKILWWYLSYLQFLLGFAVPILLLRLSYWDADFNSIELFGVRAGFWLHRISNLSYLVMLLSNLVAFFFKGPEPEAE